MEAGRLCPAQVSRAQLGPLLHYSYPGPQLRATTGQQAVSRPGGELRVGSHRVCLSSGHRPAPPFCAPPAALTSHHQLVPQRKDAPAAEPLPTTPTQPTQPQTPSVGTLKGGGPPVQDEAVAAQKGGQWLSVLRGHPMCWTVNPTGEPGGPEGSPCSYGSGQSARGREAPQEGHTTQPHSPLARGS